MKLNPIYRGILCCTLAAPGAVLAQDSRETIEEIVVTGSLIRGTPEDAALPVEVHTAENLRLSGTPSPLEFAKSLTSQGPVTGEAHYFGGAENTGNVEFNLRGLGDDKTLTLLNGRRINQNTSIIPGIATQRIEVLKDGAAVTYGADATGGVVNFITRDQFEGIEVNASYKSISGSDGDYSMGLMGGFGGEDSNVIWAAEWDHRSELDAVERDFTSQSYADNPFPWSTLTNLARWFPHAAQPTNPTDDVTVVTGGTRVPTGEFGDLLGAPAADFTQSSCEAVGGIYVTSEAGGPSSCKYNYIPYYNLVEDNDVYRLFGQVNSAVTDNMDFNLRMAFGRVHTPNSYGSPSQPVVRGPAMISGLVSQFYVPRTNPHFEEFAERSGLVNLTNASGTVPLYDPIPAFGLTGVQGATAVTYRAFAHGGNDTFAEGNNHSTPREIDNKYWHVSTGLDGIFDNGINYDFGITYNHTVAYNDNPDIIAFRLQEALNGFGGPNCNAVDTDPNRFGTQNASAAGQDGCEWYNPFASNFAGQPVYGLENPNHVAGSENSAELANWLFDKRAEETVSDDVTMDLVFTGDTPIALPGGDIAWGAGLQWRQRHRREFVDSDFYNGNQPCPWPDGQVPREELDPAYNGCTADEPGPFQFFDTNPPTRNEQDQRSVFAEFQLPVLDTLQFGLATRYEEFSGGFDDVSSTVYKVSGKWDATDNLAFRASYGTNYQAPDIEVVGGNIDRGVNSISRAGGAWLGATTITRDEIEPETATSWNAGFIWQSEGFTSGSDFRAIVDYWDIETEDELGLLASANDIADSVFSIAPPGESTVPTNGTALADCAHPLIGRVEFNGGACDQGTTTARDFASITTAYGNGPGQHTAGVDLALNYGFPFSEGDLRFGLTATRVLKDENTPTVLDGYALDSGDDRLGYLNFETVAFASSEWRANLNANYARDIHNFRFVLNYVSGVDDERYETAESTIPEGNQPGTLTPFGPTDYGVKGKDWVTADFHYNVDLPWDASLNASVHNLSDEEPPESRQELGYDPRIGNPLGRTFELGFQKRF